MFELQHILRRNNVYPRRSFAVLNAEIIDLPMILPKPILVSFDGETARQRIRRRTERWTPVVDSELLLNELK